MRPTIAITVPPILPIRLTNMTETSIQPPQTARLLFSTRQLPTASQSPTHSHPPSDDFISHLSPLNAIESFRAPDGPLKACMDSANPAERNFALRAAIASKNIYEWLDELRDWPWPAQGGVGFQLPPFAKRKFTPGKSGSVIEHDPEQTPKKVEDLYIGSILEPDLARYEKRIEQIQAELDKLEIEEIKRHVLHDHIFRLSRPNMPASPTAERHFAMSSLASYVKMDDLTAVITATVVQALPNLSKLIRLMNTWSVRLTVLRRTPTWMASLSDAENAIRTGWETFQDGPKEDAEEASEEQSAYVSRVKQDLEIRKLGLEKKVSTAAQVLDYMLDTLEGRDDTLPDEWLDRMEAVERGFSEWIAASEKFVRDAEFAALKRQTRLSRVDEPTPGPITTVNQDIVISVETADHKDTLGGHEEQTETATKVAAINEVDANQPIPSVEETGTANGSPSISVTDEQGSPQDTDISDERSASDLDLHADEFLLAAGDAEQEGSLPASTIVHSQHRDPARTPEFSPHTPPREARSVSLPVGDMPPVPEHPEDEDDPLQTPLTSCYDSSSQDLRSPIVLSDASGSGDDHFSKQISEILEKLPANIHLSSRPSTLSHLNPPDLQLPYSKPKTPTEKAVRSRTSMSSRSSTPAFMLAPVSRPRQQRGNQDIKMYHLSRANGEAPIKLNIRCVGEHGERVMVRVGGGWADLGEYLKEYALHHGRRSHQGGESRLEVRDVPRASSSLSNRASTSPPNRTSPPSRPGSALDPSPIFVKKTRRVSGNEDLLGPRLPRTPLAYGRARTPEPSSTGSISGSTGRSRSSSRVSWTEEESSLGMAGPRSSHRNIPQESLEWVESIKEKVRAVSGGSDMARNAATPDQGMSTKFGELGKVGGTKRVFRKAT